MGSRWKDIFEVIGLIAVVASLVFVGMQLRQEQIIARAELTSQSFVLQFELQQSMQDPGVASTWAKMLDEPDALTLAERIQIDSVLGAARHMYIRECYLTERNIMVECAAIIQDTGRKFFGHQYGQSWWQNNKLTFDENLATSDPIDAEMVKFGRDDYRDALNSSLPGQ